MTEKRPLPDEAIAELRSGNKINAIKIVRQQWSLDLKDAKDAVDAYVASHPDLREEMALQKSGGSRLPCLILALLIITATVLAMRYFSGRP